MAEIYQLPDNGGSNSGVGNIPFSIPIGNFGGGFGGFGGYGMNGIADLFGLAIIASMFGWNGNGGFGGGGFGGGNGAGAFLANQLNNDSGRELIMQAVTTQGEANRTAVQNLATEMGQDFNLVNSGVQNVQNSLQSLALQQAVSVPQIINSIQSGNQQLASQFCQSCCQTQQQIMAQGYENQIRTLEQTNALSGQADRNTASVRADIAAQTTMINEKFCDLEKRELQDKITALTANNTLLRSQIDNANQTAQIGAMIAPLAKEIDDIKCKIPNTVPVQWPNLVAVNTTPNPSYGIGGGLFGNGFGGNIVF